MMGVKQLLDRNPIIALVGTCAAVGSIIAAVMAYFGDQKISAMEQREQARLAELSAKYTAQLSDVTNSLKEKIADLSFKLASIQRNIPGTQPAYLDVSKIVIGRELVEALPASYTKFWDGDFYVNAPRLGDWSFSETNELEVVRLIYGEKFVEAAFPKALATVVAQSRVLLWKGKNHTSIETEIGGKKLTLSYYPMVYVQEFGKSDISKRTSAVIRAMDELDRKNDEIRDRISKISKDLSTMKADANGQAPAKKGEDGENVTSSAATPNILADADKSKNQAEQEEKYVEELSSLYSADLASFVMEDAIGGKRVLEQVLSNEKYTVFSAQKKGNVLYLRAQESFAIPGSDSKGGSRPHIDVSEETFYFSFGENGLLVKIYLPEIEGRGEDATWIRSWLAGLQIPLSI